MLKRHVGRTQKQLGAENLDLRARLNEAEEALRAIGSGDWDALVVSGAGGDQIMTLKQSELRYRRLFEAAQDGILMLEAETGAITDVNPFLINMLGYSREEFIDKKLWEVGAFKDVEASQEAFEALQKNEYIRYEDLPLKAKDGRLIQVEFVSNVYLVDNERVIQCNIQDITARKRTENALRESEERYRSVFENSFDAILLIAPDGSIMDVNLATRMMFDRTAEEIKRIGRNGLMDVTDARLSTALQHRARTGKMRAEITMIRADGSKFPADMTSAVFADSQGQMRTSMIIRDNSERNLAEADLRENEERFRQVWDTTSDAMTLCDSQGIMLAANPAYFDLFGYTPEQAIGLSFSVMFPEEGRQLAIEQYRSVFASEAIPPTFESAIRRADGTERIVETRVKFLAMAGRRTAMLSSIRDVTERKHAEEKIRRQLAHLTALAAIDQNIASNIELKLSLSQILTHVTLELGVDAAGILVLNSATQTLEHGARCGFRTQVPKNVSIRLGESYAGHVALERQPIHVENLRDDPNNLLLTTYLKGEDFQCFYGVPLIAKGRVNGVLEVFHRSVLEPDGEWLDFLNILAGQTAIAIDSAMLFESLQRSNSELSQAYDATIEGWSQALDLRDKETEGHSLRVTEMTVILARAFGLSEVEVAQVRWGALLHDIGKMGVPDGILLKPGPLTDEEWVLMKKHPTLAFEMLSPIRYLRLALDIPYCHHEKWDGSGYPRGLKGPQIPLAARIFAVVDVWDALRSDRPYRAAWTEERVREYIRDQAGKHFDPDVVERFLGTGE